MSGRSSVVESLLPKQVVVGSNPIARSNLSLRHFNVMPKAGLVSRSGSRSFYISYMVSNAAMANRIEPVGLHGIVRRVPLLRRISCVEINGGYSG